MLTSRVVDLLQSPPHQEWAAADPLMVEVKVGEDGRLFTLTPDSVRRLRALHEGAWTAASVSVRHEIASDLGLTNAFVQLAPVLTGFSLDALPRFGGIQYVDAGTGDVLWRWPKTQELTGYCVSCHQHGTLRAMGSGQGFKCSNCGNEQDSDGLWLAALQ